MKDFSEADEDFILDLVLIGGMSEWNPSQIPCHHSEFLRLVVSELRQQQVSP